MASRSHPAANGGCERVSAFDRADGFCQTTHMLYVVKKFIAVILAIWLPLFSGNALAVSVAMQAMGGSGHSVQQDKHHAHCDAAMQQHEQLAAGQDQSAGQQDRFHHADCGACHFVCCGYLAVTSIEVMNVPSSSLKFPLVSTQFQSITSYPLDPPPLPCA